MDRIFKALADKNRRMILTLLMERDLGVNEIVKKLTIGQATVSNHLAILRKASLVTSMVEGKQRIYKINREVFCNFVEELDKFCGQTEINLKDEIIVRR